MSQSEKKIRILSLEIQTPHAPLPPNADFRVFLDQRAQLLKNALAEGLKNDLAEGIEANPKADITFFTAPEFFWNIPWDNLVNTTDLAAACDLYLSEVQRHVIDLVEAFPDYKYGKIVFLPGTAAALINIFDPSDPPPKTAIKEGSAEYLSLEKLEKIDPALLKVARFEMLNYLYCLSNTDKGNLRQWPKRNTSFIDAMFKGAPLTEINADWWQAQLSSGTPILITRSSNIRADSVIDGHLTPLFVNDIEGVPLFGVDICLDYACWLDEGEDRKPEELAAQAYPLYFLICCGMPVVPTDITQLNQAGHIQFLIRNDGSFVPGGLAVGAEVKDIPNGIDVPAAPNPINIQGATLKTFFLTRNL